MKTAQELLKDGGKWLGAARNWLQWHKRNGDKVTWGSDEALVPPMTVREVEEVASVAVAADRGRMLRENGKPSKNVLDAAKKLVSLLEDPHPGLSTWHEACENVWREMHE